MAKKTVNPQIFVDNYVVTNNATESYRLAGGQAKDATQAAYNYLKKPEVRKLLEEQQTAIISKVKNATLNALDKFLENDYYALEPKDRGAFLIKMMEKTGLDVPKRVNVVDNSPTMDIPALASHLASAIRGNPAFAGQFAALIGADVVEGQQFAGGDAGASPEHGAEQAKLVHAVREAEVVPPDGDDEAV